MNTYQKIFATITIIFLFSGAVILFWPNLITTNKVDHQVANKHSLPIKPITILPQVYLNQKNLQTSFLQFVRTIFVQMKIRLKNTQLYNMKLLNNIKKHFVKSSYVQK